jgi:hypothetical protein
MGGRGRDLRGVARLAFDGIIEIIKRIFSGDPSGGYLETSA